MSEHNENVKLVHVAIKALDTLSRSGIAVAEPMRLSIREGDKVMWTFDEVSHDSYRPEIRFESDGNGDPQLPFGELAAKGRRVVGDDCLADQGLYDYQVWLKPWGDYEGAPIQLKVVPGKVGDPSQHLREGPEPPDVREETVRQPPEPPDVKPGIEVEGA